MPKKAAVITGALDRQIRDSYNAYVVFTEASSVAQAVATNGALFEGRHLRIDRVTGAGAGSSVPSTLDNKRSVFLGNLPFNVQEDELRKLLARCGEVENVRLVRDNATQHGKGFGYVHFKEEGSVEIALGMHEKIKLAGPDKKERPVRIFRCTAASPSSYHSPSPSPSPSPGPGPSPSPAPSPGPSPSPSPNSNPDQVHRRQVEQARAGNGSCCGRQAVRRQAGRRQGRRQGRQGRQAFGRQEGRQGADWAHGGGGWLFGAGAAARGQGDEQGDQAQDVCGGQDKEGAQGQGEPQARPEGFQAQRRQASERHRQEDGRQSRGRQEECQEAVEDVTSHYYTLYKTLRVCTLSHKSVLETRVRGLCRSVVNCALRR